MIDGCLMLIFFARASHGPVAVCPQDVAEFEVAQGALLEDGQGGVAVG